MADVKKYQAKSFPQLKGMKGISDNQLADHYKLYEGYVKNTNDLTQRLWAMAKEGKAASSNLEYTEMTRRLGFECNGMILHEYYFENMKPNGGELPKGGKLWTAIEKSFGTYDTWMADFKAIGGMRGIGWAAMYQDPSTGWLSNHWITLHNDGNPAGYAPLLVMDVWEHAFVPDFKPYERAKYLEAWLQNIDWTVVEKRLK